MKATLESKTIGCLLGVAVGDALGAPVEGLTRQQIHDRYGLVEDYVPERFGAGVWTDDTQLTLALARSLSARGRFDPVDFARNVAAWLPEARGAGFACATAAGRLALGVPWQEAGVESAGCGSAMRAAPLGLFHRDDTSSLLADAVSSSRCTHTDSRALAMTAAKAMAVARLVGPKQPGPRGLLGELAAAAEPIDERAAQAIARLGPLLDEPMEAGLEATGVGGFVMETVPAALLIYAHNSEDLEAAVVAAVAAGGDTDSIASMVGALSGAAAGHEAIPARWVEGLLGREEIEAVSADLYRAAEAKESAHARPNE
jgi:ADP-ribosyl-[dinitrogen reductase] hydrolase